jgi:acyl-coenzyme A thioesterase PaaI-like protein
VIPGDDFREEKMELPELRLETGVINHMCYGCGKSNPQSLKMEFSQEGELAKAIFTPTEFHSGWPGYTHGGVLMAAIDETIGWATWSKKVFTVTAKIEVRLKSLTLIGEPLFFTARVTKQTSRTLEIDVQVRREDGCLVAEAASVQFIVKPATK